MTLRSSAYKTRWKFWNIDKGERVACIPELIWSDGHCEYSRWPEFRIHKYDRVNYNSRYYMKGRN